MAKGDAAVIQFHSQSENNHNRFHRFGVVKEVSRPAAVEVIIVRVLIMSRLAVVVTFLVVSYDTSRETNILSVFFCVSPSPECQRSDFRFVNAFCPISPTALSFPGCFLLYPTRSVYSRNFCSSAQHQSKKITQIAQSTPPVYLFPDPTHEIGRRHRVAVLLAPVS